MEFCNNKKQKTMNVINKLNHWMDNMENNRFGIMAVTITLGTCWASVAVLLELGMDVSINQLFLSTVVAMGANAFAIAQMPMRWVLWSFMINIIVNTVLITINLL